MVSQGWFISKPPPIEDLRDMTMNDHIEALIALVEELVKAGDYIHDEKDCHQDCPWVSARGNAVAYLKEECQTKHAPTIGAVQ